MVSNSEILDEMESRNAEAYTKAKIALADFKYPIREIPRQPNKKTVFAGMDEKTGMAIYHNVRL